MAMVAMRAKSDKIILGGMGMTNDDYLFFKNTFSNAGTLDRIVSFINTTEDPSVERILIPEPVLSGTACVISPPDKVVTAMMVMEPPSGNCTAFS